MKNLFTSLFVASAMIFGAASAQAQSYNDNRYHSGNYDRNSNGNYNSNYNNNSNYNHNNNGNYNRNEHGGNKYNHTHRSWREDGNVYCADREQVAHIIQVIKGLSFDDQRMKVAMLCTDLCPMMADDLIEIARLFTFDDRRLEFLKYAFEYCPDGHRFYNMRNIFSFESNHRELIRYMDSKRRR